MDTSYPSLKTFSLLIVGMFVITNLKAQTQDIASINRMVANISNARAEGNHAMPVVEINSRTQSKVALKWSGTNEHISHYVIERSVNGRALFEAGIFFTKENGGEEVCRFTDDLRMNYSGPMYYRLRAVDHAGNEMITPVTFLGGSMGALTH